METQAQKIIQVPAPDFRIYLEREFLSRMERNTRYSLRSFARDLDIEPSFLSKLIRGKQKLTSNTLVRLAEKLNIQDNEIDTYLRKSAENLCVYHVIDQEKFLHISNWTLFSLIELFKIKDFKQDTYWISQRLRVSEKAILSALFKLEEFKFIKQVDNEWKLQTKGNTWSNLFSSTQSRRDLQKDLLDKAIEAIDYVPYEYRQNSSLTIACDEALVPEVKQKIKDFSDHLDNFIHKKGKQDSVYQLCVSFFPLTDKRYQDSQELQ